MKPITKLVLPIAGLGKRLLPLTKNTPKNLVKVNGKPLLEYVLEEAIESGIKDVILVTNPQNKKDFEKYIKENKKDFPKLNFYIRIQETPGGNGHAIIKAIDLINDEPFVVRFCDDIILSEPPIIKSLIDLFNRYKKSIILLERAPKKTISRWGVVGFENIKEKESSFLNGKIYKINKFVEKPKPKEAPSNLTFAGGYVITPSVIKNFKIVADALASVPNDALPIFVAFQIELLTGGEIYGWEFPYRRYDCGTLESLNKTEAILKKIKKNRKL
jgi:UTP--glucose-1-phosphate uridylyltransferase